MIPLLFSTKKLLTRTVTDPDLRIRGEPGHPDPEITGRGRSQKMFFWPFGSQFGLKIRGPSPESATAVRIVEINPFPSLVPMPVRAIRVTREGLEPSANFPDKLDRWRHIRNRRGRLGTRLDHSYFEKGCRKKVHNPERYCGWFWVHCSLKKFERMTRETMDVCLWVLKESRNSKFDSYSVRNSVLIISHITSRDCRVHIFFGNLSRNSCML